MTLEWAIGLIIFCFISVTAISGIKIFQEPKFNAEQEYQDRLNGTYKNKDII